jgi:hypothetical protein
MLGLDLAVRFLLLAGLFQGTQLLLGENQVLLSRFGFQRLEPLSLLLARVPSN